MNNQNKLMGYGFISDVEVVEKKSIFTIKIVANIINRKGFGRNQIYKLLRTLGYIKENNYSNQKYIDEGYFIDSQTRRDMGGIHANTNQILVTIKGLNLIKKLVEENVK